MKKRIVFDILKIGEYMLKIIDYELKYSKAIDELDYSYWANSETDGSSSSEIKDGDIVKIALLDEKVVGLLHIRLIGDLADFYHILVLKEHWKLGIGTKLMQSALDKLYNMNIKTMIASAVEFEGHVNSEKLLRKFGFEEMYRVKNYWNSLYPGHYCEQCGNNNCHCGVVVFLKKL